MFVQKQTLGFINLYIKLYNNKVRCKETSGSSGYVRSKAEFLQCTPISKVTKTKIFQKIE